MNSSSSSTAAVRIGLSHNVPDSLNAALLDDAMTVVVTHAVKGQQQTATEYWFDVVPKADIEGYSKGVMSTSGGTLKSCIASVRPLGSTGEPQKIGDAALAPVNFSPLLPTLCWSAAATCVVNHATLPIHDVRTRLRRGQASWDRSETLKQGPNPFTALLEFTPLQLCEDILSFICQPTPGMSSGMVFASDTKSISQLQFKLNVRHYALLSSECLACIYSVGICDVPVTSDRDSGVVSNATSGIGSQAKKIAISTLKEVLNRGHPKFNHYVPTCSPILGSTTQFPLYSGYASLIAHNNVDTLTQRIRWMHYDRIITMLADVIGPESDQLIIEGGVAVHGPGVKAANRALSAKGASPSFAEEDVVNLEGEDESEKKPPSKLSTGAKRDRAYNENGEEVFEEQPSSGIPPPAQLAMSINDLSFDVKIDWGPFIATALTDTEYRTSVEAANHDIRHPSYSHTKALTTRSNTAGTIGGMGPQEIFGLVCKPLQSIAVVADIQRTLLEASQILNIGSFAPSSSPSGGVDPLMPLMVSGTDNNSTSAATPPPSPLLEGEPFSTATNSPFAQYLSFTGTISPLSTSGGIKHSHRPSRVVVAADKGPMKPLQVARCRELQQRLDSFTGLVKRRLEQFEAVMQTIGTALRVVDPSPSAPSTSSGWAIVAVEALPFHPYALRHLDNKASHHKGTTLQLLAKEMSAGAAQEVLHWVQRNHFIAVVMQSLLFHAEEWSISLRIATREAEELAELESS